MGQWPGLLKFVRICGLLLRRRIFSLNGAFNGFIFMVLYFFIVRKNVLLSLLMLGYRRLDKWEKRLVKAAVASGC